jgi:hypothetical protein
MLIQKAVRIFFLLKKYYHNLPYVKFINTPTIQLACLPLPACRRQGFFVRKTHISYKYATFALQHTVKILCARHNTYEMDWHTLFVFVWVASLRTRQQNRFEG